MASVYVAASFSERGLAKSVMEILEAEGHRITHDWTGESVEGLQGAEVAALLQGCSIEDMEGVQNAQAAVLLHNDKCRGAYWEVGGALAADKPVIVVGGHLGLDVPIFYWHPGVFHVPHIDGAIALLKTLFPAESEEQFTGSEEQGCGDCALCGGVECEGEPIQETNPPYCDDPDCLVCPAQRALDEGEIPGAYVLHFVGVA